MAEIHVATSSPLAKELVEDVLAFIEKNRSYRVNQAATLYGEQGNNHKVANAAIYEVETDIRDSLHVKFAITLASYGVEVSDG